MENRMTDVDRLVAAIDAAEDWIVGEQMADRLSTLSSETLAPIIAREYAALDAPAEVTGQQTARRELIAAAEWAKGHKSGTVTVLAATILRALTPEEPPEGQER